jgi:hypothetical protein
MEATLGISVYSYHYLKLAKTLCHSHNLLSFLFSKIGKQEGGTSSSQKCVSVWGRRWPKQCTCVSKCKNYKILKNKAILGEMKTTNDMWLVEEIALNIAKLFNMANHLK